MMQVRSVSTLVSLALLVSGCAEVGENTTGPKSALSTSTSIMASSSGDSISWGSDDKLEFTDASGDNWLWEREGPQGEWSTVRIYKNGVHEVTYDLTYVSGNPTSAVIRDPETDAWMDTDYDGDITDESSGGGAGGGPVNQQGTLAGDDVLCSNDSAIATSSSDDCEDEFDSMQDHAWDAALSGGMATLAVAAVPDPLDVAFVANFAGQTVEAAHALGEWGVCKIT